MSLSTPSSRPGRPRSKKTSLKVMKAALDLALEGVHYATIERISSASGVAKSTIYRRWSNAAAVVMDAFLNEIGPLIAYDTSLPIMSNFQHSVMSLMNVFNSQYGQLLKQLLGAAQFDSELSEAFVQCWIEPRRKMGRNAIVEAVHKGELSPEIDPDFSIDLIYGAVYYRLIVTFDDIDQDYIASVINHVFSNYVLTSDPPH